MSTQVPRLLTLAEVAKRTGVPRWRLYEMMSTGLGPPHMRFGKTYRFSETKLVDWIEDQHVTNDIVEEQS